MWWPSLPSSTEWSVSCMYLSLSLAMHAPSCMPTLSNTCMSLIVLHASANAQVWVMTSLKPNCCHVFPRYEKLYVLSKRPRPYDGRPNPWSIRNKVCSSTPLIPWRFSSELVPVTWAAQLSNLSLVWPGDPRVGPWLFTVCPCSGPLWLHSS